MSQLKQAGSRLRVLPRVVCFCRCSCSSPTCSELHPARVTSKLPAVQCAMSAQGVCLQLPGRDARHAVELPPRDHNPPGAGRTRLQPASSTNGFCERAARPSRLSLPRKAPGCDSIRQMLVWLSASRIRSCLYDCISIWAASTPARCVGLYSTVPASWTPFGCPLEPMRSSAAVIMGPPLHPTHR